MSAGRAALAGMVVAGCMLAAEQLPAGDDGPRWHSEEWYQMRADDQPGARQKYKYGKLWPPYPRPVGKGQSFWHKYHHAHYWPNPYLCEDRAYVNGILDQQTHAGWEQATTLHDLHFDPETHRLNSSGEGHLRWILLGVPAQYRSVSIAQAGSAEASQFRLAQVQEYAQTVCGGNVPPIQLKYDTFLGRPAIEIDTLRRLELQSIPQPRLFIVGPSSGGSSSSPSSAQAGGSTGTSSSSSSSSSSR